jgi:hypothetical protein
MSSEQAAVLIAGFILLLAAILAGIGDDLSALVTAGAAIILCGLGGTPPERFVPRGGGWWISRLR